MRRIIFESAESWRIMRRRYDYTVCVTTLRPTVVAEDGVRDDWSRGIAVLGIEHYFDAVGCEHLQCSFEGGLGERMRIKANVKRPVDMSAFCDTDRSLGLSRGCVPR